MLIKISNVTVTEASFLEEPFQEKLGAFSADGLRFSQNMKIGAPNLASHPRIRLLVTGQNDLHPQVK